MIVCEHCALSELLAAPCNALLPPCTGEETTLPRFPVHVHGLRLPVSKPPLTTALPGGGPVVGELVRVGDAVGELVRVGELVGDAVGEPVRDDVGVGEPVPVGDVQLDALPFTSLTTALNSVVPGSRSYSENIIAPPRPLQCR